MSEPFKPNVEFLANLKMKNQNPVSWIEYQTIQIESKLFSKSEILKEKAIFNI